ncbi:MAG: KTSC domain-containing protein [Oscillospiraceae bacterium]
MRRMAVDSSRIRSVGWENNVLEVEFMSGAVYHHYDVSESEYRSFLSSSSLGDEISVIDKTHRYSRVG